MVPGSWHVGGRECTSSALGSYLLRRVSVERKQNSTLESQTNFTALCLDSISLDSGSSCWASLWLYIFFSLLMLEWTRHHWQDIKPNTFWEAWLIFFKACHMSKDLSASCYGKVSTKKVQNESCWYKQFLESALSCQKVNIWNCFILHCKTMSPFWVKDHEYIQAYSSWQWSTKVSGRVIF